MDKPDDHRKESDNSNGDDSVVPPLQFHPADDPTNSVQSGQHKEEDSDERKPCDSPSEKRSMSYWRKFREAGADRHIELAIAALVAVFAVAQFVNSCENNRSTSTQVSQIIVAANSIKGSAGQFSESAERINNGIHDAVGELNKQARNFHASAEATQNSIVVSEQAYLIPAGANIDESLRALMVSVLNIGHLPAIKGKMRLFEMTVARGTENSYAVGFPIGKEIEGHWSEWNIPETTYVTPPMLWTPLPGFSREAFTQHKIGVLVSGRLSYNDGFRGTPRRNVPFCYLVFYDSKRLATNSIACDEIQMTERIKKAIHFPNNMISHP